MKILLSNKFYYRRGGADVYVIGLEKLLIDKGHEVAIFSMNHAENLNNNYNNYWLTPIEYSKNDFRNIKETILRPIYSKEVKKKFLNLINDFQPDIVHLNNIHSQISPIIAEIAYKKNIPVVWTLHDYKLLCPAYTCSRDSKPCELCFENKINVLKYRCIKNSYLGSFIGYLEAIKWNRIKLQDYTKYFISPSLFLKKKLVQAGYDETKIVVINNFLDNEKLNIEISNKENYYCYFGRLSHEKGIETLLKAASKITDYSIKIIGTGPLEKDLKDKYNSNNIDFLGYMSWEELNQIVRKAAFTVIPSEWYENYPLSVLESFALGTPVIGSRIGGIPELVKDVETGLLFEPGNSVDLAAKIVQLINQPNLALELGRNAFEFVKENHSAEKHYSALIDIYTKSRYNR